MALSLHVQQYNGKLVIHELRQQLNFGESVNKLIWNWQISLASHYWDKEILWSLENKTHNCQITKFSPIKLELVTYVQ